MFISREEFYTLVADQLQLAGGASALTDGQKRLADRARDDAERDLRHALGAAGWTEEQIAAWPEGKGYSSRQSLYWWYTYSSSGKDYDQDAVKRMNVMPQLATLKPPLTAARPGGIGHGPLSTAGNLFPRDFTHLRERGRRGDRGC